MLRDIDRAELGALPKFAPSWNQSITADFASVDFAVHQSERGEMQARLDDRGGSLEVATEVGAPAFF
jgi:hypothetical protein